MGRERAREMYLAAKARGLPSRRRFELQVERQSCWCPLARHEHRERPRRCRPWPLAIAMKKVVNMRERGGG